MHAVIILLTGVAASVIHLNLHIRCVSSQSKTPRPIQSNRLPLLSRLPLFFELYIEGGEGVAVMHYRVGRVMKPEDICQPTPSRPVLTFIADDCKGNAFTLSISLIITHLKRFAFYVFISHKVEVMCWFQPWFSARGQGSPPMGTILWQAR